MEYADLPLVSNGRPLRTQVNHAVSPVVDSKTEFVELPCTTTVPSAPAETTTLSHTLLLPSPNSNTVIRYVMTVVALLLIVAAFLSIFIASQYHFLLFCVWLILFIFFVGFCYFIQETAMNDSPRRRRQIFHPAVHAMGDWIASGIKNFVDDCQSEYAVLLLSNEAAHDHYRRFDSTTTRLGTNDPSRTRPRTKLFRVVVQPVLNMAFWRRRKQPQKQHMPFDDVTARNTTAYAPPITTVV
jgi:hypothetical protein